MSKERKEMLLRELEMRKLQLEIKMIEDELVRQEEEEEIHEALVAEIERLSGNRRSHEDPITLFVKFFEEY